MNYCQVPGDRLRDFARWRVSRYGLASNERLGALMQTLFDTKQFEDLRIPTAMVATDLGTGEPVVFLPAGESSQAIRASCAFPGLFEPITVRRCLADGGLVAPVPPGGPRNGRGNRGGSFGWPA